MKRTILFEWFCILMVGFLVSEAHSESVTNWGDPVQGVRVSISITTNVFSAGVSSSLECSAQSSTNELRYFDRGQQEGTQIFLVGENRTKYRLTIDRSQWAGGGPTHSLEKGETQTCSVSFSVAQEIPPGDYTIYAEINMYFAAGPIIPDGDSGLLFFRPISNSFKIMVK